MTHQLECEAREWIRRGYTSKSKVTALMKRITKQRGPQAADDLRAEMRQQYKLGVRK